MLRKIWLIGLFTAYVMRKITANTEYKAADSMMMVASDI